MLRCTVSVLLLAWALTTLGQPATAKQDLQSRWTIWNGTDYVSYHERSENETIHFSVSGGAKDTLLIKSPVHFSVYLNHKLVLLSKHEVRLPLDSLRRSFSDLSLISIYQKGGIDRLRTEQITVADRSSMLDLKPRTARPIFDFSILATLALAVFLVSLFYTNLHHVLDYLNVLKLFAIQEREDSVLNSRVSASVNIVFYLFTSLLGGLVLLVVFNHAPNELGLSRWFVAQSVGEAALKWLALSMLLLLLLLAKFVLVALMTSLFNWREHLPLHYFNFIRLSFFGFMVTGTCCLFLFVAGEQNPTTYARLLWIIGALLLIGCLLFMLKLMARIGPRFFHLFSYLCASEFIPVVITIKILLS